MAENGRGEDRFHAFRSVVFLIIVISAFLVFSDLGPDIEAKEFISLYHSPFV